MNKKEKITITNIVTRVCFIVMVIFMVSIAVRFITRQVFIEKLGWDNLFTRIVFFGDEGMGSSPDENGEVTVDIDWQDRYPFSDKYLPSSEIIDPTSGVTGVIDEYRAKVLTIEQKIEVYTTDLLFGHMPITRAGKKYNDMIGFENIAASSDEIITLNNGYLTYKEDALADEEIKKLSDNVSEFSSYLKKQGIYFLYANAGSKVCPSDKQLPYGAVENTNENADKLLFNLKKDGVNVLDYRPYQEQEYKNWYDSYYITDHHWKNTTGLWAAGVLADRLNTDAGFEFNDKYFDQSSYTINTKENYFLGGQGRSLTTAIADLEPFSEVLPKFKTDLSIQIPTRAIDKRGRYDEVLFRKELFDSISEYSKEDFEIRQDTYGTVMWCNDALGTVTNHITEDNKGKRLLMIQDSFGWYLSTYLATDIEKIDFLNLNSFTGSLCSYIEETKPDAVVLLLCERNIKALDEQKYAEHTHFYDFR